MKTAARYLTTDLYLAGERPLDEIFRSLVQTGLVLDVDYRLAHCDDGPGAAPRYNINLNARYDKDSDAKLDPETEISLLLTAVERLSDESKNLWSQLSVREFSMGFECGDRSRFGAATLSMDLPSAVLARLAAVGASLGWAFYPPETSRHETAR